MLKVGIIDANERTSPKLRDTIVSVVGNWLAWECDRAGVRLADPADADIVFLVHAGAVYWLKSCRGRLKRHKIPREPGQRGGQPYVIAGGQISTVPHLAFQLADAVAVGEGYGFARGLLEVVAAGGSLQAVRDFVDEFPHSLSRDRYNAIPLDPERPWLFAENPPTLATPDTDVDWSVPLVRSGDKVVRILASKGCRGRCRFCATTWSQPFQANSERNVLRQLSMLRSRGERSLLVTNDVADLPYFEQIYFSGKLDSQSLSLRALKRPVVLNALTRTSVRIIRIGVEGVSERVRKAVGKPIANDELVRIISFLQSQRIRFGLFFIAGLPFETDDDWTDLRGLYQEMVPHLSYSLNRIKFTTYLPSPPAPLVRFWQGPEYYDRKDAFKEWMCDRLACKHYLHIWGTKPKSAIRGASEITGVPADMLEAGPLDLLPTVEDAERATWEVIGWPATPAQRWRSAEYYRERMSRGSTPH